MLFSLLILRINKKKISMYFPFEPKFFDGHDTILVLLNQMKKNRIFISYNQMIDTKKTAHFYYNEICR